MLEKLLKSPPPRKQYIVRFSGKQNHLFNNKYNYNGIFKESGFTLAEILITLGIIGVVAALTMPSLISHYRKKALQTTLLKTYAELQQANLKLLADGVSLYETSNTVDRAKLIMGQFQGKTAVDGDNNWDASNQRLKELYGGRGLYGHADNHAGAHQICDNGGIWTDNIGRLWLFNDSDKQICVDINGTKGPNRYGYDYFIFYPGENNKIIPHYQYPDKEWYITDGTDGRDYTYYAISNQHPVEAGKTYWEDYIHF